MAINFVLSLPHLITSTSLKHCFRPPKQVCILRTMFNVVFLKYLSESWGMGWGMTLFLFLWESFVPKGAHKSDQGQIKEK